jgi:hypothetical protein
VVRRRSFPQTPFKLGGWLGFADQKGTTEPHAKFGLLNEEYKNMTKVAEERHDERAVNVPFSFLVETSLLGGAKHVLVVRTLSLEEYESSPSVKMLVFAIEQKWELCFDSPFREECHCILLYLHSARE